MSAYVAAGIGSALCVLFVVGFGKFFFGRMAFTDPSQSDEVNAGGAALQQRWARRFDAAWPLTWRICVAVIIVSGLVGVVSATA
jgi:hypothetical protein